SCGATVSACLTWTTAPAPSPCALRALASFRSRSGPGSPQAASSATSAIAMPTLLQDVVVASTMGDTVPDKQSGCKSGAGPVLQIYGQREQYLSAGAWGRGQPGSNLGPVRWTGACRKSARRGNPQPRRLPATTAR